MVTGALLEQAPSPGRASSGSWALAPPHPSFQLDFLPRKTSSICISQSMCLLKAQVQHNVIPPWGGGKMLGLGS